MPKLNQRGVVHLLLPLILIAGIIGGVYLITSGNPLKLFSKASNSPIVFKSLDNGKPLPINKDGTPFTTSPKVIVELTSTLGPPVSATGPISGPNRNGTVAYRTAFNPTDLRTAQFTSYLKEPTVVNVELKNTPGLQFYWVEFKDRSGRIVGKSAAIILVSNSVKPTPTPKLSPTPKPTASPTPVPTPTPVSAKRVFVTSTNYNGNLGGLSGADAKCQIQATAANLGGNWKAWLSDSTGSPSTRFTKSTLSYKNLNGGLIANNWDDLVDGSIQNPIAWTETKTVHAGWVWTNTSPTGTASSLDNCSNWSSAQTGFTSWIGNGNIIPPGSRWTQDSGLDCWQSTRLYCFEQ